MNKPSGLKISTSPGGTLLDWDDNTESDFGGFKVFASDTSATDLGSFVGLGETGKSEFLDTRPIAPGTTRFYRVSAFSKTRAFTDFTPLLMSVAAPPTPT